MQHTTARVVSACTSHAEAVLEGVSEQMPTVRQHGTKTQPSIQKLTIKLALAVVIALFRSATTTKCISTNLFAPPHETT